MAANFAPWVRALDLTITEISADRAVMAMPNTPDLARIGGIVSGQALSALADTAMVFAGLAGAQEIRPIATTNLDVQFLRPGVGDQIICTAHVVRRGKALIFTAAEMVAQPLNKPVATATATFFVP